MKQGLHTLKFGVMKKILFLVAVAAFMVACNTPQQDFQEAQTYAEYQAWKAARDLQAEQKLVEMNTQSQAAAARPAVRRTTATRPETRTMSSESQSPAKAPAKKGWSKAAKGAVIGAGSGAVIGAVVHKRNRALGAVVGGVIGGGVGYGIGRSMDKKDGRVQLQGF